MYWGDGREDPMYTNIVVLERVHKLSEEKQWVEVNPYGREAINNRENKGNSILTSRGIGTDSWERLLLMLFS